MSTHTHLHKHIHIHEKRKHVPKTEGKYAWMLESKCARTLENIVVEAQLLTTVSPLLWEQQQSMFQGKKGPCLTACFVYEHMFMCVCVGAHVCEVKPSQEPCTLLFK